jgi:outer membrane protein OmpA-like peptidoglycan-associated protein
MRPSYFLLLIASLWGLSLAAQKPVPAREDTIPASRNWTPRAPLSAEEQQRRADKAAELEAMRERFRRYQQSEEEAARQRTAEAQDGDFLWSEAEAPLPAKVAIDTMPAVPTAVPDTERLRLEIGRNLQMKGETTTPAYPSERPAAYDLPSTAPPPSVWESRWQEDTPDTASAATDRTATEWALDLGQDRAMRPSSSKYTPGTILPLAVSFTATGTSLAEVTQPQLEEWLLALHSQPTLQLEIRAHSHVTLDHAAADQRSRQRAQAVVDYLLTRGVAPDQLKARGYGKRQPLTYDLSAAGQQQNERIEIIVLQQ